MRSVIISANDAGQRVDKFISKLCPAMPVSLIYKAIRTKKIKVNRKRTQPADKLIKGDELLLFIADEFFEKDSQNSFKNMHCRAEIVYEDKNIIVCAKPSGMKSQPDSKGEADTLDNHIKAYLYQTGEYDPERENSFVPALCNRIDRNTTGLVIAAKNAESLRIMNEKIKNREIDKRYLCAVHGKMPKSEDLLRAYLFKDGKSNTVSVRAKNSAQGGKEIITGYRVLAYNGELSLLEITLHTGRTHQIRAHMAFIGHPLLGEGKYAENKEDRKNGYTHQELYSYKVSFNFVGDSGILSYLAGKSVTLPESYLRLTELFEGGLEQ